MPPAGLGGWTNAVRRLFTTCARMSIGRRVASARFIVTLTFSTRPGPGLTVVHASDGFSCTWFDHNTRITGARSVALSRQDVLVVPEWYGPYLRALPIGPRIVVFNQNAYSTFAGLDENAASGAPLSRHSRTTRDHGGFT